MDIKENLAENSFKIAEKLIQAIEGDEQITSSSSLSFQAVRDNLPAICHTVVKAIANNNFSLLFTCENNQGREHGYVRSRQDFTPEGIGLGLGIVSQLVSMLTGKIELISEVDIGSTFTVIIPLYRQSQPSTSKLAPKTNNKKY